MRARNTLFLLLVIFLSCPAEASYLDRLKDLVITPKSSDISVEDILSKTQKDTNKIQDLSIRYVKNSIKNHNRMISDFNSKISNNFWKRLDADDEFQIIHNTISDMYSFYSELNNRKNEIADEVRRSIKNIEKMQREQDKAINTETKFIEYLEREIERESNNNQESIIRKRALQTRINLSQNRLKMLKIFNSQYSKILPIVSDAESKISVFITLIENNAEVYNEALLTLDLQRDIKNFVNTLEFLDDIDELVDDLFDNWAHLDNIMKNLSEIVVDI